MSSVSSSDSEALEAPSQPVAPIAVEERVLTCIRELLRFASLVQQFNAQHAHRIDKSYVLDREDTDGTAAAFESYAEPLLNAQMGETFNDEENAWLKERLLRAMMWRWRRICHRHYRAEDLVDTGNNEPKLQEQRPRKRSRMMSPDVLDSGTSAPRPAATSIAESQRSGNNSSRGFTLPPNFNLDRPSTVPSHANKTSKSASKVEDVDLRLPAVPTKKVLGGSSNLIVCPYCGSLETLTKKNWK